MVENCDGKLRALGIYRATAHFARKMVGKWRHIREETKRKMALLKRKTRLGQITTTSPLFPASFEQTQRVPTGHPDVCLCDVSGATD